MRIIIKDKSLNLKVKTDSLKLAETILTFLRNECSSNIAQNSFRAGLEFGKFADALRNIRAKENAEGNSKDSISNTAAEKPEASTTSISVAGSELKKKRKNTEAVEWTDQEILFIKNNYDAMKSKYLIKSPALQRHTASAILTKRHAIKYKRKNILSKKHFELISK
jgi:hypothetical protein